MGLSRYHPISSSLSPCDAAFRCRSAAPQSSFSLKSSASLSSWRLLALVFVVHHWLHVGGVEAQSAGLCLPKDFSKFSSPTCVNGTRSVQYNLDSTSLDRCTAPFNKPFSRKESCACTPDDFDRSVALNQSICTVSYLPQGCVLPPKVIPQLQLDPQNCTNVTAPCTSSNVRSVRTKCQTPNVTHASVQRPAPSKFLEIVYYFDQNCDPNARNSIRLPPKSRVPCDHWCGPGSYLQKDSCQPCKNGTFSLGGGIRHRYFDDLDPTVFKTKCKFQNSSGTQQCNGWSVKNGALQVGPFDQPNTFTTDECDIFAPFPCHNSLSASLSTTVELVRDGYVKFEYTVSSEVNYDGLSFFIDFMHQPVLGIESSQIHPKQVNFSLEAGVHTLTWVYSKDGRFTQAQDTATISLLEIMGTAFSDPFCSKCSPGFYSGAKATECSPCSQDTFSPEGSSSCSNCTAGTYSLTLPRTTCYPRPACDVEIDAEAYYSSCNASTMRQTQAWKWKAPQICRQNESQSSVLPIPKEMPCPPCPPGLQYKKLPSGVAICDFCPTGTQRNATSEESCTPCPPGDMALKELTLAQMIAHNPVGRLRATGLPGRFLTGCSGDCGSRAWHLEGDQLNSGVGHGPSVSVWLSLAVQMARDGQVSFNMSVDIPTGDTQRGFFFHIDDYPIDQVVDDEYDEGGVAAAPFISGPWPLTKGSHRLMWTWMKVHAASDPHERDTAIIYDINIEGTAFGGATSCVAVPVGAVLTPDKSGWLPCPPGTFSIGGSGNCTPCPANTFNDAPMGGPSACIPCGHGTTSNNGSTECFVGDINNPNSFCTYMLPGTKQDGVNLMKPLFFDLSPLARAHPGPSFGPIYSDPSSATKDDENMFYVSVCQKDTSNSTCYDYDGNPLNAYACRTDAQSFTEGDKRPGHSVGKQLSIKPLAMIDSRLERRGLVMNMDADGCPKTGGMRHLSLSFICDPGAGYGEPEAWTEKGLQAAYDPTLEYPNWINRGGPFLPIQGAEGQCNYSMVWYTAFACPACWPSDYEAVVLSGCPNNTFVTYKFKEPKTCQPNHFSALPKDVPCRPCGREDYTEQTQQCQDSHGKQNVTYRWNMPKVCNEAQNGSVKLPQNVLAGPCIQEFILLPSKGLSRESIILVSSLGAGILFFATLAIVNCCAARRMYQKYAKLVDEKGSEGDLELPEDSEGPETAERIEPDTGNERLVSS